jgi:hypothetical protein
MMAGLFIWMMSWVGVCVVHIAGVSVPGPAVVLLCLVPVLLVLPIATRVGEHVVYAMQKCTPHPGPRSSDVHPSTYGEDYRYVVKKCWTVADVINDARIKVVTRTGKTHLVKVDDPHLRKVGPLESLMLRLRWHKSFPDLPQT